MAGLLPHLVENTNMLDFSHLVNTQSCDIQIFDAAAPSTSNNYVTWNKPRGTTMAYIFLIGGGGGGGGGIQGGGVAAAAGGGGGGSAAQSVIIVPTFLLPDTLYLQIGNGGLGGVSNTAGNPGISSNITIYPYTNPTNNLNGYLLTAAGGGAGGSASNTGGAAGAAGAIATPSTNYLCNVGMYTFTAGQAGIIGAANTATAGGALSYPATGLVLTGGTGGGGCSTVANAAGGQINAGATGYQPLIPGGVAPGGGGSCGYRIFKPILFTGGTGSASISNGTPAPAGVGGFGCGGGGGGGGSVGGRGGDGGPGLAVIISW